MCTTLPHVAAAVTQALLTSSLLVTWLLVPSLVWILVAFLSQLRHHSLQEVFWREGVLPWRCRAWGIARCRSARSLAWLMMADERWYQQGGSACRQLGHGCTCPHSMLPPPREDKMLHFFRIPESAERQAAKVELVPDAFELALLNPMMSRSPCRSTLRLMHAVVQMTFRPVVLNFLMVEILCRSLLSLMQELAQMTFELIVLSMLRLIHEVNQMTLEMVMRNFLLFRIFGRNIS